MQRSRIGLLLVIVLLVTGCGSARTGDVGTTTVSSQGIVTAGPQETVTSTPGVAMAPSFEQIQQSLVQLIGEAGYPNGLPDPEVAMGDKVLQEKYNKFVANLKGTRVENWRGLYMYYNEITSPPYVMNGYAAAIQMKGPDPDGEIWPDVYLYFKDPTEQQKQHIKALQDGQAVVFSGMIEGVDLFSGSMAILEGSIDPAK